MPLHHNEDGVPVVRVDPTIEISPFELFEQLRDPDARPLLVDLRPPPRDWTLRGAIRRSPEEFEAPHDRDAVVFDEDGRIAPELVRRLRNEGQTRVWALFGGLDLYRFCLDPEIVETDTLLIRL
jgi:hypothetical protein